MLTYDCRVWMTLDGVDVDILNITDKTTPPKIWYGDPYVGGGSEIYNGSVPSGNPRQFRKTLPISNYSTVAFYMDQDIIFCGTHTETGYSGYTLKTKNTWLNTSIYADYHKDFHRPSFGKYNAFFAQHPFSLKTANDEPTWTASAQWSTEGKMLYATSKDTQGNIDNWQEWDGTTINAVWDPNFNDQGENGAYVIYMCGCFLTSITDGNPWEITSSHNDVGITGYWEWFSNVDNEANNTYSVMQFYRWFDGCTALKYVFLEFYNIEHGSQLTQVSLGNYWAMYAFRDCSNLVHCDDLNPTTIGNHGFSGMFENCTSLVSIPDLPCMNLGSNCYEIMFSGCTGLGYAALMNKELPATTVPDNAYHSMFSGCSSIQYAIDVSAAITVGDYGMCVMFGDCDDLYAISKINATSLGNYALMNMYVQCPHVDTKSSPTTGYVRYRIPYGESQNCTAGTGATSWMFGWSQQVTTPAVNTNFYVSELL